MKIGIVIPLRSKITTEHWDIICLRLHRTVMSLARQTKPRFRAVVVGHDCPDFFKDGSEKDLLNTEFCHYNASLPPRKTEDLRETYLQYEFDRCKKLLKGMMLLQACHSITHWYALDGDDLLHPNFIEEINKSENAEAFVIQRGYSYFHDKSIIRKENEFSAICGSCTILSSRLINLPTTFSPDLFRATPFGNIAHNNMLQHLNDRRVKVVIPKPRLVMYVRGHGANLSDMRSETSFFSEMKFQIKNMVMKPLNASKIQSEFGVHHTSDRNSVHAQP